MKDFTECLSSFNELYYNDRDRVFWVGKKINKEFQYITYVINIKYNIKNSNTVLEILNNVLYVVNKDSAFTQNKELYNKITSNDNEKYINLSNTLDKNIIKHIKMINKDYKIKDKYNNIKEYLQLIIKLLDESYKKST